MRTFALGLAIAALLPLSGRAFKGAPVLRGQEKAEDHQAKAQEWIAKADSTRALVDGVLKGAVEAGAEEHAVAKDNVADARRWMSEGDKRLEAAKAAMEEQSYEAAEKDGNMAWQYYVKAGTAAVLAARLVGGGGG